MAFEEQNFLNNGNVECNHGKDEQQKINSCNKQKFLGAYLPARTFHDKAAGAAFRVYDEAFTL